MTFANVSPPSVGPVNRPKKTGEMGFGGIMGSEGLCIVLAETIFKTELRPQN
jgi:hypothetical protein